MVTLGTLFLTLSAHVVTGNSQGAITFVLAATTVIARVTLCLTPFAMITRFACAGAVRLVTLLGILLHTQAFFGAPGPIGPRWAG